MKIKTLQIVSIVAMCAVFELQAQIANTGTMHISEGTDVGMLNDVTNTTTGVITNNGNLHLHKSLTNNGTVNFTPNTNTGLTIFKGNEVQNISGTGTTLFYSVNTLNTAADASIQLSKEIKVYGNANLTDGVINELANGLAVFQNKATHSNTSDDSFIDGKVHKQGNEAFTFPIGDENSGTFLYRMAGISAPSSQNTIFSAEYKWENSNALHAHTNKEQSIININANEYWVIEPTKGKDVVDVTLSWNSETTPESLLLDTDKLIIVRWDGTQWVNEGGKVDIYENTITARPKGYGIFTLATKMGNLSVDDFPDSFSPNNDGINDVFEIPTLAEQYPNFIMKIYNRYGNLVYDYSNNGKKNPDWWNGISQGRFTLDKSKVVPASTYWYIIDFNDGKRKPVQKWLYLNK